MWELTTLPGVAQRQRQQSQGLPPGVTPRKLREQKIMNSGRRFQTHSLSPDTKANWRPGGKNENEQKMSIKSLIGRMSFPYHLGQRFHCMKSRNGKQIYSKGKQTSGCLGIGG